MPHLMPLMRQYFDMFHFAFLFVAILAALLGGVIGCLRGKPQGAAAGAITGEILGGALSIVVVPASNYLILHSHYSSQGSYSFRCTARRNHGRADGGNNCRLLRGEADTFP